jgi:hypothetical protein
MCSIIMYVSKPLYAFLLSKSLAKPASPPLSLEIILSLYEKYLGSHLTISPRP